MLTLPVRCQATRLVYVEHHYYQQHEKISEDLIFEYDRAVMMKPWRVRTAASERIDLVFEPEFERVSECGRRDSHFTSAHQMFGCYSGRLIADGGIVVEVGNLFGWIEEHEARW